MMSTRRVAITGAGGQLGSSFLDLIGDRWELSGPARAEVDITQWHDVRDWLAFFQPDLVIHAAANTDVDGCERDPQAAMRANAVGTRYVASAAAAVDATVVYVSTNFVFDGSSPRPYHELDEPSPISVYGATKLAGEREVEAATHQHYVVRTSMVFARSGRNFVNSMLRLFDERDQLRLVSDQYGNPTYAEDLAHGILQLIDRAPFGTYHMTNSGQATWFDWADEIRRQTSSKVHLAAISGSEFERAARPPENGLMDSLFLPDFSIELPDWRDALARCLAK